MILSGRVLFWLTLLVACVSLSTVAQEPEEQDYYRIETIPIPQEVMLEVGGMTFLPDGRLAVATRRGEVWLIDNPTLLDGQPPHFHRFAHGLHEALGLAWHNNSLYSAQRSELTRLHDTNGDAVADHYEVVYSWPLEGNYHEYSYGPLVRADGSMIVALNLGWIGYGASQSLWRGWMIAVDPDRSITPIATGMRSPAGMGTTADGALFYAENQGDWVGSGYITHVETGDFVGNPAGLRWTSQPTSPLSLKPEDVPDSGQPLFEVAKSIPELKPPAVWFPHTILGISTSDIVPDTTGGAFGPFSNQLFVGDQGHSKIARVNLEQVDGVFQGAAFPFREGFSSGVLRMAWDPEGGMIVGMTSRGWGSTGKAPFGLQRLVWTGDVPFEIHELRAMPDGFTAAFTLPVDIATAEDLSTYAVESFTYKYHSSYGSPPINIRTHPVQAAIVADDGLSVRLVIGGLRDGYIYQVALPGLRSAESLPLLHDTGYYTLNRIPTGPRLTAAEPSDAPVQRPDPDRPASWSSEADHRLSVGTRPNLLFDTEVLTVGRGHRVALTFDNNDDMLHNLVVVHGDSVDAVSMSAMQLGLSGHAMAYVPESDAVLAHTGLLEPGTSETIYFTAPDMPGTYVYVCTFPGHAATMRGILRVVDTEY